MPIFEFGDIEVHELKPTTFSDVGLKERNDLQRLLRANIHILSPETIVISEEFGHWEDADRRIDLLGVDRNGNLVVVELKRTEGGDFMDLQAIRYAAMISNMTFEKACDAFGKYLKDNGSPDISPRVALLDHLGWDEPQDDFAGEVRIVSCVPQPWKRGNDNCAVASRLQH